jgi:hypothetical protein
MPQLAALIDRAVKTLTPATRYQLGKLLGLKNVSTVYQWHSGTRNPSAKHLLLILDMVERRRYERKRRSPGTKSRRGDLKRASAILTRRKRRQSRR